MTLLDWERLGWVAPHRASPEDVGELLAMAGRDLEDCEAAGLSADWRLNIAYSSALHSATAALAAAGYRAARESHHYRVIGSLAYTVGVEADLIDELDAFRKKRNISSYERAGLASEQEAKEMIALAENLRRCVRDWLWEHHPDFLNRS